MLITTVFNALPLIVIFAALLCVSVERDVQAKAVSSNPYGTPEHTKAQKLWHFWGAWQRGLTNGFLVYLTYGVSVFAGAVLLHLAGWLWLLFDIGYNLRTGKPVSYAGEFAATDKLSIAAARWFKKGVQKIAPKSVFALNPQFIPLAFKVWFILLTGYLLYKL